MISEDDFQTWLDADITQHFLTWVKSTISESEKAWASALFAQNTSESLLLKRIALAERIALAAEITNVSYEDLYGEQERSDSDRVQTPSSAR